MEKNKKTGFNAFQLKMMSLGLYVTGRSLIAISYTRYDGAGFELGPWVLFYYLGYIMTYIAFPIIAFLTVEAVLRTRNLRQLFTRLAFAAIFTELLLDLVTYGKDAFNFGSNFFKSPALEGNCNFYFTMVIGAVAVCLMEKLVKPRFSPGSVLFVLFSILIMLLACVLATVMQCEQGSIGVLTISAFYMLYDNRFFMLIGVAALQLIALGFAKMWVIIGAPIIGTVPVLFYDHKEGYKNGWIRLITYAAYPCIYGAVLLILRLLGGKA